MIIATPDHWHPLMTVDACHLGNIALKTGEKILWDGEAEKITNSARANALLTRQYRAPWQLPGL